MSIRKDKIKAHSLTEAHKQATQLEAEAEELARCGGIVQAFDRTVSVDRKAFLSALKIMHWLAKEEVAQTTKFESLIKLVIDLGGRELKALNKGRNAKYTSEHTIQEMVEVLSATVREEILAEVHASPFVGILCDESTDISVTKQLVVYIKYITQNGDTCVRFLKLIDLSDGKAVSIEKALIDLCAEVQIPIEKVAAFGSDGASVMVGHHGGVATLLKAHVPHLVSIHCVAHRLALATSHASESVSYIKKYSKVLQTIYAFYHRSSVCVSTLHELQLILGDPVQGAKKRTLDHMVGLLMLFDVVYLH